MPAGNYAGFGYEDYEVANRTEDLDQWPQRMPGATVAANESCFG